MKKILSIMCMAMLLISCTGTKKVAVQKADLSGEWNICRLADLALVATEEVALPLLTFDENGYHMYCGCNYVNGSYTIDGDQISFTKGMSTKMFCPDVMEMEDALTTMLSEKTYTIVVEDGAISLQTADGAEALRLVK